MSISYKNAITVKNHLHIDNWSEKHNKNNHLTESFEGNVPMKNVADQKYLGLTPSEIGCNVKSIIEKRKQANGIIREIQFLIKGLGKFTFEGAMIYLNSLLRSSILFAAKAMYNLKENELRLLERIEET